MQTYLGFSATGAADGRGYPGLSQDAYLTIGNFDGVHRGHQALAVAMAQAAHARGCLAGLLTFDPHPLTVLRPDTLLASLTSAEERAGLLAALGLDFVLVLPFSRQIAARSAAEFMQDLTRHIPLRALWIGPDFALGRGREGDAGRLAEIGAELGYRVQVIPPFDWLGQPVRSSRIRALLSEDGDATQAAALLGRPYQVWGMVTEGARRGRTIGFPTANFSLPPGGSNRRLVPANGVYACWVWREDRGYPAVVNVGVRPTFDNAHRSIEAFLLDFSGDLYGETLGLSFVERLREEQRFGNVAALIAQIAADTVAARRILCADPAAEARDAAAPFWRELQHTADWAIEALGDSQRQLFTHTATAMYLLQGADPARPITLARAIQAEADAPAELLVAWLNRLLLGQEIGNEMYTRFEIHAISPRGVLGVAYGYAGAPAHTAIKAVTYHDLSVQETGGGWAARVTFDV
ncbi:MAG: Bifunctional riboflavin kinase/FMN adenylyltransferase [Chloroflexota bacterium]|nr:Bifunctional riboflavin kinase/FMN adenylyltransferase [Chloroflexota bacterium]